jgi:tetratricopeptide (TPR) repeat protein
MVATNPDLEIYELLIIIGLSGMFGGYVSALLDNISSHPSLTKISDECKKCSRWYLFCRAIIGIAGAFGVVFIAYSIDKVKTNASISNILYLISMSIVAGAVSFRILPKIGTKLEEQLLLTDKKADDAIKIADDTREYADDTREYTAAIEHAGAALTRDQIIDVPQAIERLSNIKEKFKDDRTLYIYLGRLFRKLGQYDDAILILREFIRNINNSKNIPESRCLVDKADAYFNIACYHVLKAKDHALKNLDHDSNEKERMLKEAIEALSTSISILPTNKDNALKDIDFEMIKDRQDFKEAVAT